MSKEIKCLHCESSFQDRKGYAEHCKAAHTGVYVETAMPWCASAPDKPPKPTKRKSKQPKKPKEASAHRSTKHSKGPKRVVEVSADFKPKSQTDRVKMLYSRWVGVKNSRDGQPWYCKGCAATFPSFQEVLDHLKANHSKQVRDFSEKQALMSKRTSGSISRASSRGVFSGFGMSAGWAMPMGGGLPGLGKNK